MRIITLIPPIMYFGLLLYDAVKVKEGFSVSRFQLGMLLTYFFLVFVFLCADFAGNTEAATNTNTVCLFILPIFIILSFYNTYEAWKNKFAKRIVCLNLSLSILYYCLFYFSMKSNENTFGQFGNKSVNGIIMAVSILLVFQFAYMASRNWQQSDYSKNKKTKFLN